MIDIEHKSVEELRELNANGLIYMADIPEYRVWANIKTRCNNPNNHHYPNWGGRGITVCKEWDQFWTWFKHIGRRPRPGLTQDRIDNDKGYEPGNVRWGTYRAQANNKRHPIKPGKTSAHRGVSWHATSKKWTVHISVGYQFCAGYFANETDAAICYNYHVAYLGLDRPLNYIDPELYIHD